MNKPSLRYNLFSNIVASVYLALANLLVLPLFLRELGSLEFGLIAFYTVIYGLSQMLDMGMSPLLGREAASFGRHPRGEETFARILRSMEIIAVLIAVTMSAVFYFGSGFLLSAWLSLASESDKDYTLCIAMIGMIAGLRTWSSLYRGTLKGLQRQLSLNVVLIVGGTLRYPVALAMLVFVDGSVQDYFALQLLVAVLELLALLSLVYFRVPACRATALAMFWKEVKPRAKFSLGIAYASGVWVLLTQMDKLILSTALPVETFGYFVLASTLGGGILLLTTPITDATLPKLTAFHASDSASGVRSTYLGTTMFVACVAFSTAGVLAFYAFEVVFVWTGNRDAAQLSATVLPWLAYGTAIASVSGMLFQLQVANGSLRMHTIYNSVLIAVQLPLLYFGIMYFGVLGAALAWVSVRALTLLAWTPFVHGMLLPGIHRMWIGRCVLLPLFLSFACVFCFDRVARELLAGIPLNQITTITTVAFATLMTTSLCAYAAARRFPAAGIGGR